MTVLLPSSSSASLLWWPSSSAAAQLPADRREAKSKAAIKRPRLVYLFSAQITAASFRYFSVLRADSPDGNSDDACRTSPSNLFPPPLPKPLKGDQSREASVSNLFLQSVNKQADGCFPRNRSDWVIGHVVFHQAWCQETRWQKPWLHSEHFRD